MSEAENAPLDITPTLPTLGELLDSKGTFMGKHGPIGFASADLALIREAATALETEYAAARLELSTKAVEYLQVFKQLEDLQDQYDLESAEADSYARKAHAGDDLVAELEHAFSLIDLIQDEGVDPKLASRISDVMARVAARPPPRVVKPRILTTTTAEVAPLVALEF